MENNILNFKYSGEYNCSTPIALNEFSQLIGVPTRPQTEFPNELGF